MGILPINLGTAKLQRSEHTFVHYFNLQPLLDEYDRLNDQHDYLHNSISNNTVYTRETGNYNNIISYLRKIIKEKFNHIGTKNTNKVDKVDSSNKVDLRIRNKRGLINGLGSIIKGITGNLDNQDGNKIYAILNHLKNNQNNLQNQLKMQYSINHQIIQNFNDTIGNIQHNEILLKSRIMQLNVIIQNSIADIDILFAKDLFNQLIIIYNNILNTLQEIETSLTFCKLKTLHPSIIKSNILFSEIERISNYYKEQLAFPINFENILDFESIIQVNCKTENNIIHYLLSMPIYLEKEFELYHLLSIPTKYESEFRTIIPDTNYLIKSDNYIKPLTGMCVRSKIYHCPSFIISPHTSQCGREIILNKTSSNCQYTKLNIKDFHIEYIPEIDQYLSIFPTALSIKIHCKDAIETKQLQGIYLIKQNNCKLIINNQEISHTGKTYGNPTIIQYQELHLKNSQLSNFTINLKNLQMGKLLPSHNMQPETLSIIDYYKFHVPSVWTIILYIILIIICVFVCLKFRKIYQQFEINLKNSSITSNIQPKGNVSSSSLQLPGEASF